MREKRGRPKFPQSNHSSRSRLTRSGTSAIRLKRTPSRKSCVNILGHISYSYRVESRTGSSSSENQAAGCGDASGRLRTIRPCPTIALRSINVHREGLRHASPTLNNKNATPWRSNSWNKPCSGTWYWGGSEYMFQERIVKSDLPTLPCKRGRSK